MAIVSWVLRIYLDSTTRYMITAHYGKGEDAKVKGECTGVGSGKQRSEREERVVVVAVRTCEERAGRR